MLTARSIQPEHRHRFFVLAAQAFEVNENPEASAKAWARHFDTQPGFSYERLRGVYDGDALLGGCIVHERLMNVGDGFVPTACIGAVVTDPAQRGRGVGRALLEHCTRFASERGHGLLLLDGIANFYNRFGYVDVWVEPLAHIELAAIRALPESGYSVREATLDDTADILRLYDRHFGPYTGSFRWDEVYLRHRFALNASWQAMHVAVDGAGRMRGYLFASRYTRHRARDVAADDWPAVLALLKLWAGLHEAPDEENASLIWPLPPRSTVLHHLTDHIRVRVERTFTPNGYWMARVAHLPALFEQLLPVWRGRWRRGQHQWSGNISLKVEGVQRQLVFAGPELAFSSEPLPDSIPVSLPQQSFCQLIFGYRPVSWYAPHLIPEALVPVLEPLFPPDQSFIPGNDFF